MRFLHIADLHLDTPFAGRSDALRSRLRAATRTALTRCVDTALAEGVDALLIAGDLFDGDFLSFDSERFLLGQLARLHEAGIRTVYATGNHDPGDSRRTRSLDWPATVTVIAADEPATVAIGARSGGGGEGGAERIPAQTAAQTGSDHGTVGYVTGIGHAAAAETRNLAGLLQPVPGTGLPQVALLHTQVVSSSSGGVHRPYAPSSLDSLRSAGFHYWALGHVHNRQELSARPAVHYSGSIQGRSPGETGPRGGLLVDLAKPDAPVVEFREFAPLRWEKLAVAALAEARSLDDAVRVVEEAWKAARQTDPGTPGTEWILAAELAGPSPLWQQLRNASELDTMAEEVAARLGLAGAEVSAAGVRPPVRVEEYAERPDVLGSALRLVRKVATGAEPAGIGEEDLAGFDPGRDGTVAAYLARILAGAEEEIVVRMLDPEEIAE